MFFSSTFLLDDVQLIHAQVWVEVLVVVWEAQQVCVTAEGASFMYNWA